MKKLFISVPMNGKTDEEIDRYMSYMKWQAEIIFDQPLEVIKTHVDYELPDWASEGRLYKLGNSIALMSEADYYIGVLDAPSEYRGCKVENLAADLYKIPRTYIPYENLI